MRDHPRLLRDIAKHVGHGERLDRRPRTPSDGALRGFDESTTPSAASRLGFRIDEGGVRRGHDVAELAHGVHGLVIADEEDGAAARARRLRLERHREGQHLLGVGSAIEQVPFLHEDCQSASPTAGIVDEARPLKDGGERRGVAVHIGNGHDAGLGLFIGIGQAPRGRRPQRERCRD